MTPPAKKLEKQAPAPEPAAPKEKPFVLDTRQLPDYIGQYYSDELETTYTARIEDGQLNLRHHRTGESALRALAADTFLYNGRMRIAFQRNAQGKVTGLTFNTGRMHDLAVTRLRVWQPGACAKAVRRSLCPSSRVTEACRLSFATQSNR